MYKQIIWFGHAHVTQIKKRRIYHTIQAPQNITVHCIKGNSGPLITKSWEWTSNPPERMSQWERKRNRTIRDTIIISCWVTAFHFIRKLIAFVLAGLNKPTQKDKIGQTSNQIEHKTSVAPNKRNVSQDYFFDRKSFAGKCQLVHEQQAVSSSNNNNNNGNNKSNIIALCLCHFHTPHSRPTVSKVNKIKMHIECWWYGQ